MTAARKGVILAPMFEHVKPELSWQRISDDTFRSKIPGGWLVRIDYDLADFGAHGGTGTSITFVPDPEHKWDGGSVE